MSATLVSNPAGNASR